MNAFKYLFDKYLFCAYGIMGSDRHSCWGRGKVQVREEKTGS